MALSRAQGVLDELKALFGPRALLSRAAKEVYRYDAILVGPEPLAVVLPESREEVAALVRLARRHGVVLVPRGAGSGLSGGAVPEEGSIVVAFTRMTRLEVDPHTQTAWAEPGVTTARVSEAARPYGLFYPPDPASYRTSTLGGNLAENAGGPLCFKYGVTGDYVLELEWVDDEGGIQRQGRAAYDLPGLLIGSEGTLGLVTGARLRLLPLPRHRAALLAHFPGVEPLAEAVSEAVASGAVPARMEFMDPACAGAVEDYLRMGLPRGRALLLVETDGEEADLVEEELSLVEASARRHGAEVVRAAGEAVERCYTYAGAGLGNDEGIVGALDRLQGLRVKSEKSLRIGQKLKLPVGAFHAEVSKSNYQMKIYAGEGPSRVLIAIFPVGLGELNSTPTGAFMVRPKSKLINPEWNNPRTGEHFASDDPKNPIGERWIGLIGVEAHNQGFKGYGIHGTVDPASIGKQASMGCVRMSDADVELVYEFLTEPNSTIVIAP